jgi:S-layer protein (TIGR01567 family)
MNKKITAVTLTALMVLTMFTAMVPSASAVEKVEAPYEFLAAVANVSGDATDAVFKLNSTTHPSILYYDLDEGEGNESLEFTVNNSEEEIKKKYFEYKTTIYNKDGEVGRNWIAWLGEPYYVVEAGGDWYLSKLLVDEDDDDEHLLRVGETMNLPNGFAISPLEIDVDGEEAWFTVTQDGEEVESLVVDDDEMFIYETDLNESGDDDNWVLTFWVESVFAGMNTNLVKINSTQLLDPEVTLVETPDDDVYDGFNVDDIGVESLVIELDESDDTVDLKRDGIVHFLDKRFSFRINEDGDYGALVRVIEEPGTYELFAAVANVSGDATDAVFKLNSTTHPSILYYDLDEGEGNESLEFTVNNSEEEIKKKYFEYKTTIYNKDGEVGRNWIAWLGEPYYVVEAGGDWYLSKLLVDEDDDDEHLLRVGETMNLPNGFAISPLEIDVDGEEAWFTVTQDGEEVESLVVDDDEMFIYETDLNESGDDDNWVLTFWVESVFAGMNTNLVKINSTQLLDPEVTLVETPDDDVYDGFNVDDIGVESLVIELDESDDTIDLKRDGIVYFLDDRFSFRINEDGDFGGILRVVQVGEVEEPTETATPTDTVDANVTATPIDAVDANVTATATTPPTPEPTPTPTPTKEPGFEAVFAVAGLLAVAYLVLRQRE